MSNMETERFGFGKRRPMANHHCICWHSRKLVQLSPDLQCRMATVLWLATRHLLSTNYLGATRIDETQLTGPQLNS